MKTAIEDFLFYIASEKGLAKNTVEAYRRDLFRFASLFPKNTSFSDISEKEIRRYLNHLQSEALASSSIYRAMVSLKSFFKFLRKERLIDSRENLYLDTPKMWQLVPEVLTEVEVQELLEAPDSKTPIGARDRAILEILYASGLRVSEICGLNIPDVGEDTIRACGKGGKERIVPVALSALKYVDHYLLHHRSKGKNETLFVSRSGKRLDRIAIYQRVKLYAKQVGLSKPISPHTLRHCFATHLLENGADLRIIQEMLGHADIATTDRYTQISHKHLQSAFEKFHPKP